MSSTKTETSAEARGQGSSGRNEAAGGGLRRIAPFVRPALPRLVTGAFFALLAGLAALAIPQALERVVNGPLADAARTGGGGTGEREAIIGWMAVILGLGLAEAACIYLRRILILRPSTGVEYDMRMAMFRHLQDLPIAFHDRWAGGQLLSRAVSDLGMLRRWIAFGSVTLVVNTLTIAVGAVLLIGMVGLLGVIYLLGGLVVVALSFNLARQIRFTSRAAQDKQGDLATAVEESVHGIRVLKAFGRGEYALDGFSRQAGELREIEMAKARSVSSLTFGLTALPDVVLAICLLLGIYQVSTGTTSVGHLVAFFATAAVLTGPIEQLGMVLALTLGARTAIDRYGEVMDTVNTVTDPEPGRQRDRAEATLDHDGAGAVEFREVAFAYESPRTDPDAAAPDATPATTAPAVLEGIDLRVEPGETLALVGLTGSGKSTLAMLVPRLYDVRAGQITLDGVDIRAVRRSELRRHIAFAFEEATLFSDTVRENVLLGAPDYARTDAHVQRALDIAAADFVADLPQGLDTQIGEEGMSLSGGQRQRLALARAIAARPRVMVLDDPLSALDVDTEERVQTALREELSETTTLLVAHRPSTVALADRVALLHEGRIVAVDTHSNLLATDARYRHVISSFPDNEPLPDQTPATTAEEQR